MASAPAPCWLTYHTGEVPASQLALMPVAPLAAARVRMVPRVLLYCAERTHWTSVDPGFPARTESSGAAAALPAPAVSARRASSAARAAR